QNGQFCFQQGQTSCNAVSRPCTKGNAGVLVVGWRTHKPLWQKLPRCRDMVGVVAEMVNRKRADIMFLQIDSHLAVTGLESIIFSNPSFHHIDRRAKPTCEKKCSCG